MRVRNSRRREAEIAAAALAEVDVLGSMAPAEVRALLAGEAARRGLDVPASARVGELREEMVRRGLLVYPTFRAFVEARNPTLLRYEHIQQVLPVVDEVVMGRRTRLMVFWPTQYLKSEVWSRLLPAYYLLRHTERAVALASYGADLAWELSGEARDHYAAAGGRFRGGSPKASTRNWRTLSLGTGLRGGMWAAGVGGPGLGRGYNLGIVDDPIAPLQVRSAAYLRRFQTWWTHVWLRGQRPHGAGIVFIMQRLAVDDPAAWLLEREQAASTAEHWHIIAYDEVRRYAPFAAYGGPRGFPPTCTVAEDTRAEGAVLAPSWRGAAEVAHLQSTAGPVVAAAQRQQRPVRAEGYFWQESDFAGRTYTHLPAEAYDGGWDWDTAYTENVAANAATAGVQTFRGPGDLAVCPLYVEDVRWGWWELPEAVERLAALPGPHYVEKKASGKSVVQVLRRYGVPAQEVGVVGDKLSRAAAAQPAVRAGRVYVNARVVTALLYGEGQGLLQVTAAALQRGGGPVGLDLNDAFVQAVWRHLALGVARKDKGRVRILGR